MPKIKPVPTTPTRADGGTRLFREMPPERNYFVAAGLDDVLAYLEQLHFTDEDLAYLRHQGSFADAFPASSQWPGHLVEAGLSYSRRMPTHIDEHA